VKILLLSYINFEQPYGSHIRPYFLSKYLHEYGFDISVVCIKGEKSDYLNFIERKWLNSHPLIKYGCGLIDLCKLIQKLDPDVVLAHESTNGLLASISRKFSKLGLFENKPVVVDFHGSTRFEALYNLPSSVSTDILITISSVIEKVAISGSDLIITASDIIRNFLIYSYKIDINKVFTIPNGVSTEHFYPLPRTRILELRKNMGFNDKSVIVMSAPRRSLDSSDWSIKAIKVMYKVMSRLYNLRQDIILLVFGGGPIPYSPPPNVFFTGFVKDLNIFLNIADLAIAPYPENMVCGGARNKVLEYFACKVPVISTMSGMFGIPEAKPYVHYIPTTYDPEDIANKILLTLDMDSESLLNIIDNAYQLIITKYNWKKSAQILRDKLITLLK